MKPYPYSGRDLFKYPEHYFYAECTDPEYLDSWKRSRELALKSLLEAFGNAQAAEQEISSSFPTDAWITRAKVWEIHSRVNLAPEDETALLALIRAYEIRKTIHAAYTLQFAPYPNASPAGLTTYIFLASCLARLARRKGDLQALSTLLKVCDAICSTDLESLPYPVRQVYRDVLLEERALVGRLL